MDDDRRFSGIVGIVGSGKGIYILGVFFMNIGLARSMGTEVFGSFQQVFMFSALFTVLTLGIPETMYFFLPRLTAEERPGFLGQTLVMLGLNGFLNALVLWIAAPSLAGIQGNPEIVTSIRVFGLYGAFLIVSSFADPVFITFRRLGYLFVLSGVHGLVFILLTVWQYMTKADIFSMFAAIAFFGLVKLIVSVVLVYRMRAEIGPISFFGARPSLLLQLSYSIPIAMSTTIEVVSKWLDKFVVSFYFGPQALGIFYVGAIEIPLVNLLLSSVYSVASPVLNKLHHDNDTAGFADFINKMLEFTAKLIWPLFIYLIFFAGHLIPLVFKSDFLPAVVPFRVYLLMMPVRIALYGVIIIALGRSVFVFWGSFGAMVLNLVLNILLVRQLGFIGPAIATVISTYLHVVFFVVIILKLMKVRLGDILPVRAFIDIGLSSMVAVSVAILLTWSFSSDLKITILSLSIFSGTYIILGLKAGFITIPNFGGMKKGGGRGGRNDSQYN